MKKQDALNALYRTFYSLRGVAFDYDCYVSDPQALLDCLGIDYNDYESEKDLLKDVGYAVCAWDISKRLYGIHY